MYKNKLLKIIFLISIFFGLISFISAENEIDTQEYKTNLHFFSGEGCPHCKTEKAFLESIKNNYPNLNIIEYEVWNNKEHGKLLQKIGTDLDIQISGVPFTIVGNKTISGYSSDALSGKKILRYIEYCINNGCDDLVTGEKIEKKDIIIDEIINEGTSNKENINNNNDIIKNEKNDNSIKKEDTSIIQNNNSINNPEEVNNNIVIIDKEENNLDTIHLPFLGELNIKNYSLPIIAIIIGTIDGFNPCAMWILIFLISMLLGMQDRKRMWILGSVFILSSAIVYFFFMTAWLNIILFFGFLLWIRVGIGIFAILGGIYNLKEYHKNKDGGCSVVGERERDKTFTRVKKIIHEKSFLIAILGISLLAIAVNIVELLCSAGLPVIFTQILTINNLSNLEYYLYIIIYVFFFMLDDLIVFIISMLTLKVTGITTKYTKYTHLIGGILMVIIGILLIFKPEILMFG